MSVSANAFCRLNETLSEKVALRRNTFPNRVVMLVSQNGGNYGFIKWLP